MLQQNTKSLKQNECKKIERGNKLSSKSVAPLTRELHDLIV